MLKYIIIVNWIAIALLGCMVAVALLFPSKGGDSYGRAMGDFFVMAASALLVILLALNLIPFPWAKYTAFCMLMLPFAYMLTSRLFDDASSRVKYIIRAITYTQSDHDGSSYFSDLQCKAILAAIFKQDVEKVEAILREPVPMINGLDTEGEQTILDYTATHYSPYSNDWAKTKRILELLIAAGATINSKDSARVSTHAAAIWNATPELLKFFLDHGADPNALGEHKVPILFEAVRSGGEESLEKVKLLLDRGANVNAIGTYDQTTQDYSPLLLASSFSNWDICMVLIEKGANLSYESPNGSTVTSYVQLADKQKEEIGIDPEPGFNKIKALIEKEKHK
eukprot:TRINITY_DN5522_c0_g1_i1.p1 TRINITY_DN5522_c0_g1~~TRINITY_DN5522_c0_g1_i1.p1  ORF type:complete len:339 (+),score=-38.31 TRINITY_DN5522_c0_g1_i1:120-1136(+)